MTDAQVLTTVQVAELARVQRPVVSMWRLRSASTDRPFPQPLAESGPGGAMRFDAAQVIEWLAATGRGNNDEATQDVAAHLSPRLDGRNLSRSELDAVSALLCLTAVSDATMAGRSQDDLLDLADEHDPDDELLYRECAAVGARLPALGRLADQLTEASFSPAAALDLLSDRWLPGYSPGHARARLSPQATSLVAALGAEVLRGSTVIVPAGSDGSAAITLANALGEEREVRVHVEDGDAPTPRWVRRRLTATQSFLLAGPRRDEDALALAVYPTPDEPSMSDLLILNAIDRICESLSPYRRALVVAPASTLCEPLTDRRCDRVRSDLIRAGHVQVIVRLPRGLAPRRGREALAIWVLGAARFDVPPDEHRMLVGDLLDVRLSKAVSADLAADLLSADATSAARRAWGAVLRPVLVRTVLAAAGSLVELSPPAVPTVMSPEAAVLELRRLESRTRVGLPALEAVGGTPVPEVSAIEVLVAAGRLRVLQGVRVRPDDVTPLASGLVPLLGTEDVLGRAGRMRGGLDPLDLGRYRRAVLTEPGDVVFCTAPRPTAVVDPDGGSLVTSPARVLRLLDDALVPAVVARDINVQPDHARHWRRWTVHTVPTSARGPCREGLARLEVARRQTRERLHDLDAYQSRFIEAMAGRLVTVSQNEPQSGTQRGRR